jgi:hypothetical protein
VRFSRILATGGRPRGGGGAGGGGAARGPGVYKRVAVQVVNNFRHRDGRDKSLSLRHVCLIALNVYGLTKRGRKSCQIDHARTA